MITVTATNIDEVEAFLKASEEAWYDEIVDSLRQTGRRLVDKAINKASSPNGFNNITYNLRSSIGMCLVDETGVIVETYFPLNKGVHGNSVGKELAERLAIYAREVTEMSMIFVAGEEYARFVQAKGKDVIDIVIGKNMETEIRKLLKG
jgi:hypothetical protein